MGIDTWLFIVFLACLGILAFVYRKQLVIQRIIGPFVYLALYRSTFGIGVMKRIAARFSGPIAWLTPFIIGAGFLGMAVVSFEVVAGLYTLVFDPQAAAGVALVLPVRAKGIFFVPFLYWIISIFAVVLVHEGAHGVLAAANRVPVKSSGLAALAVGVPVLPAAFVEPDEKKLQRKSGKAQLGVYAAGPFANIAMGAVLLGLLSVAFVPFIEGVYEKTGVTITKFADGPVPIKDTPIKEGAVISAVDGSPALSLQEFNQVLQSKKPGDAMSLTVSEGTFSLTLGEDEKRKGKPYLGVFVEQSKKQLVHAWWVPVLEWLGELLLWMAAINIGVGLFNLLPLGIVDGGRMLHVALHQVLHQRHAVRAWAAVSGFFLIAVVGSIVLSFLK